MGSVSDARVPCSYDTHGRLKEVKRDGQTFDDLLQQMLAQYDPEAAKAGRVGTTSKSQE